MTHKKINKTWLSAHKNDYYRRRAQHEGYRSRSAYKLLEIQEKERLILPGMWVADLGAAPGGWSQMAAHWVTPAGKVFSIDRLPIKPIAGVTVLQGDFRETHVQNAYAALFKSRKIDLVICDIAPNLTGHAVVDQACFGELYATAFQFVRDHLKPGGDFLVKVFYGCGYDEFVAIIRAAFERVLIKKPSASRKNSAEAYLVAKTKKKAV